MREDLLSPGGGGSGEVRAVSKAGRLDGCVIGGMFDGKGRGWWSNALRTDNRQESGYTRAGREFPATELLVRLNTRLTVSKNTSLLH